MQNGFVPRRNLGEPIFSSVIIETFQYYAEQSFSYEEAVVFADETKTELSRSQSFYLRTNVPVRFSQNLLCLLYYPGYVEADSAEHW